MPPRKNRLPFPSHNPLIRLDNPMKPDIRIPFNKPFIVGKELYYIAEAVITNKQLCGDGPFTKSCEKWLEDILGCKKALLTHSCTAALEMASLLFEVKPGDEVIMPSFTFVSTANAFALQGAVPVFVDIRPDTLNMDEKLIRRAITPKTKVIVPVHYAGVPCAMDDILKIAEEYHLWVVEDAAQALMSTYKGKFLGTLGQLGCLSFHETKNIISGEGGALLINSEEFIEKAEIIREKGTNRRQFYRGQVDKYTWVELGSSFLPSDLIGAFLYAQLEQGEKIIKNRREAFEKYNRLLRPLEEQGIIRLPFIEQEASCNGHLYYIITRSPAERTELINYMAEQGIYTVFHYVPLHSSIAGTKYGRTSGSMEVTDDLSSRLLRLPLYYDMTDQDIEAVVKGLTNFFCRRSS